ncbi:hypothetical protein [Leptospira inadai]|nr:hypothetical protein [Leptospira inadai]
MTRVDRLLLSTFFEQLFDNIGLNEMRVKYRPISFFLAATIVFLQFDCKNQGTDPQNQILLAALVLSGQYDPVGESVTSALDSVSSSMEGLTGEGSSLAFSEKKGGTREALLSVLGRFWNRGFDFGELGAYNLSFQCWGGGSYKRQVTSVNGYDFIDNYLVSSSRIPNSAFFVSKTFQDCTFLPFTSWQIEGSSEAIWSGLSGARPFIQSGSTLTIGLNRKVKSGSNRITKLTGTGSSLSFSGASPSTKQAASISWTSVSGSSISFYTQTISILREGYIGSNPLFSHTISTPTPLQIGVDKSSSDFLNWYRIWGTGTIQVVHQEEGFTATVAIISPVKWRYVDCLPKSGSISFTLSGSRNGSGTVIFSGGKGSYSYSGTDTKGNSASGAGLIDFSSCSIPTL